MASRIEISDDADTDLFDILDYTWREYGAAQAARYQQSLRETFALLAEAPLIARERGEFDPPVRIHPHQRHLIVYRVLDGRIRIERVLHHAMDIDAQL